MLNETRSAASRSFRRLNGPADLVTLRRSCLSRLEAEHERLQDFANVILGAGTKTGADLRFFEYGFLAGQANNNERVLHATHDAGLFSCLTTIMWSILEIQRLGLDPPTRISNTFGMDRFKPHLAQDTFNQWFENPTPVALKQFCEARTNHPLSKSPRIFDHHGDYHNLYHAQLGTDWLTAYLQTYMQPSRRLQDLIQRLEDQYNIKQSKTLVVCYRGTDKHTELKQDPIQIYLDTAKRLAKELDADQVMIQTDQHQVRSLFKREFQNRCRYIKELPVTSGSVVLHQQLSANIDRETWSLNLLAMVFACSRASVVLSHTGNLGLFLSLLTLINGGRLLQLR